MTQRIRIGKIIFFFTIYLVICMQYKHRDEKYADKCKVLLTCEAKGRTRKEIGM